MVANDGSLSAALRGGVWNVTEAILDGLSRSRRRLRRSEWCFWRDFGSRHVYQKLEHKMSRCARQYLRKDVPKLGEDLRCLRCS